MKKTGKYLAFLLALLMMLALLPAAALAASEEPASEEPVLDSEVPEEAAQDFNPLLSLDAATPYEIYILDGLWQTTKGLANLDKDTAVISPTCTNFSWSNAGEDGRLLVTMDTDMGIFVAFVNTSPTLAPDTPYVMDNASLVSFPDTIPLTSGGVYYTYEDNANILHAWALFSDDNKNLYFLRFSADLLQPEALSVEAPAPSAGQSMEDWEDSATIAPEYARVVRLAIPKGTDETLFGDDVFMPGETYELSFVPFLRTDKPMMLDPRKDFSGCLLFDGSDDSVTLEQDGNAFTYTVNYTVPMTADVCDWFYAPEVSDKLTVVLNGEKDMDGCDWVLSLLVDSDTLLNEDPLSVISLENYSYYYEDDSVDPLSITDGEVTYLENKDERTLHVEGWFETEDGTVRTFSYDGGLLLPEDVSIDIPMPKDGESFDAWRARAQMKPHGLDPILIAMPEDDLDDAVFHGGHFYEFYLMFDTPEGYTFTFDHDFSKSLTFAGRNVWFENMGEPLSFYAQQTLPTPPAPPAPKPAAPQTGDSSHALLWAVLVLGLGSGAVILGKKKFN